MDGGGRSEGTRLDLGEGEGQRPTTYPVLVSKTWPGWAQEVGGTTFEEWFRARAVDSG